MIQHANVSLTKIDIRPSQKNFVSANDIATLNRLMGAMRVHLHLQTGDDKELNDSQEIKLEFNETKTLF